MKKKYYLFFNYLDNRGILSFINYDHLSNEKNSIKKHCIFLYKISDKYNLYITLIITIDMTHIFLNNILINKFYKIYNESKILFKKKNKIVINKCCFIIF